jgi:hypothetical protein
VFFGLVEDTIPMDVRLLAVSPRVDRGVFSIVMLVQAKRQSDIANFMDRLIGTGTFRDVIPATQQQNDDGTITATLSTSYLAPAKATSASTGRPRP